MHMHALNHQSERGLNVVGPSLKYLDSTKYEATECTDSTFLRECLFSQLQKTTRRLTNQSLAIGKCVPIIVKHSDPDVELFTSARLATAPQKCNQFCAPVKVPRTTVSYTRN